MSSPEAAASADGEMLAGAMAQPAGPASARTVIRARSGWQPLRLAELWRARDLLVIFTIRDIKARYKQTFFGFAWAIVVPLVQVAVFTVFFGHLLGVGQRVNEATGRVLPYALFALSGQVLWNFFSAAVLSGSQCLLINSGIIRKVYVPRLVLPLSALGKPALDAVIVMALLLAMTAFYAAGDGWDVVLTPRILLAPLCLLGVVLPGLGLGLILAAVTVRYRDVQHVLPFAVQTLFYLTPVIYPVQILPARLEWLIFLNPVAGLVQAHRACVLNLPVEWAGLGASLAVSLAMLVFGAFYFARVEREFADVA